MADFECERRLEREQLHNRIAEIQGEIYTQRQPITPVEQCITGKGRGPERAPAKGWKPFTMRSPWGGLDEMHWFRMRATVPAACRGQQVVALIRLAEVTYATGFGPIPEGGDALAYVDGVPTAGIDRNHEEILLTRKSKGGESYEITLEAQSGPRFESFHIFQFADLAVRDNAVWEAYWDFKVVLDVVEALPENYAPRLRLQALLTEAVWMVDLQRRGQPAFHASLPKAQKHLRAGLKQFDAGTGTGTTTLVGHAHIDTAWLWPLRETRRKCGRTWSSMLRLMDQYPEFRFSASQPAQYAWVKENYPELYAEIKKRVKEGRWELCGAPWVEQDNQMPSGESLVRQFLYGNRFFQAEFGKRSRVAWLPDAFGFPWSLPQIMRKAGVDRFHTVKPHWGRFSELPYHLFFWRGIDGTEIFTSMPIADYNGNVCPKDLIQHWDRFKQKDKADEVIFSFGYGDGGGGATSGMMEHGRRLANMVGVPKCRFDRAQDTLDRLAAQTADKKLPVWNGELYLEYHRACQTTQAHTKRNNRKSEFLLHNTEFVSTMAHMHGGSYDQESINAAWRIVLTNQFHDILPGSSITEVYRVAAEDYEQAQGLVSRARNEALATLTRQIDTRGPGRALVVFNPLSWVRTDIIETGVHLPKGALHILGPNGSPVPHQRTAKGRVVFEARDVPPLGYTVFHVAPGPSTAEPSGLLKASVRHLENEHLRIKLDHSGLFTSVYDKVEEREVLAPGAKGNMLQLFDDRPHAHDAWDVDHNALDHYWEPGKAESIELIEEGPVRAVIKVVRATERSRFTQYITLYAGLPRVDVRIDVDWQEEHVLLKVAFPVDILSPRAAYHIQYGVIERPTHRNRANDRGMFEVTGHHWADLSEGDYGVSLLNDATYSYDTKDNVVRLSLLRAPGMPDPVADRGQHTFTYSLYPHVGDWRNGTVQQGFELNNPCFFVEDEPAEGNLPATHAFASVDQENVILDCVKKAEDSSAVIVRLFETYGQRGPVTLTFGHQPRKVSECDLMEENETALAAEGHTVRFDIKPYEIRTFKVQF